MARQILSPRLNAKDPPPFWELGGDQFEELCCDLLSRERGISRCDLFGPHGQAQFGIDLKAWREDNNGIEVAQCKAQKRFSPAEIRSAGKAFTDHWNYWQTRRIQRFILIVACELSSRQCHKEIEAQEELFREYGISFEAWSNRVLVNKLAPHPDIVSRHFEGSGYWVRKICGHETPKYQPRGMTSGALVHDLSGITKVESSHLAHRLSESIRGELEGLRSLLHRGHFSKAQSYLLKLTSDGFTWPLLDPSVRALALRLQTGLALERGDLSAARTVLQELETLGVPEGQNVLRAAIAIREEGAEKALEMLSDQIDPDARRLEAALLLETGDYAKALRTLDNVNDGNDSEAVRLRAMAYLYLGEGEEAFSAAQTALDLQPEWLSVRIAFITVSYFATLSPIAWPKHPIAWPQPISWALVQRDDESLKRRRRAAEEAMHILKEADLDRETRRLIETIRLACLACNPENREESEAYCQELVRNDRLHVPAIAWALGRAFRIDLSKNRKALEQHFNTGRADVNQIIALVACHLHDGRRQHAEKLLTQAQPAFEREGQFGLWLIQKAHIPSPRGSQDQDGERLDNLRSPDDESLTMLAAVLKAQERQNSQELSDLAKVALENKFLAVFVEACEALARHGEWPLLAPFTHELVEVIGTADAARMAALATFNQGRFEECLEVLSQAETLFPGKKLSADLVRLRVQALVRLGRSPEAIALAEQIAREEQTSEHLIDLIDLCWAKGDVHGAAFHARALGVRPDLPPQEALRTAARIASADSEIARELFKKVVQMGVPDELLAPTIYVAQRLGEWGAVQPLIARADQTANSSESSLIRKLTPEEFQDFQRSAVQEATRQWEDYIRGRIPAHLLVAPLNLSLAWLLDPIQIRERGSVRELQHPPLYLFHGGRGIPSASDLPASPKYWRLHIDTTALLIADALSILPAVEQLFSPLLVPRNLPLALTNMEELEHQSMTSTASRGVDNSPEEKRHQKLLQWIRSLRAHVSHGIDRGTYRLIPESATFRTHAQSLGNQASPEHLALAELLEIEPATGNFVWIDDRLATAFLRSHGGFIVGVTDILIAMETYGCLAPAERFEKLHQLRSANARYLHLSSDELLHQLYLARVDGGHVEETQQLRVLRHYFASCFEDEELLQRPPVPDVVQNQHGEIWFLSSFERALQDTLIEIFSDESATQEERWARAEFVWYNLRVDDLPSLLHSNLGRVDPLKWLSLDISGLLVRSALRIGERSPDVPEESQELLTWFEQRVLRNAQQANPDLTKYIAESLKELLFCAGERELPDQVPAEVMQALLRLVVDQMPESIRILLLRDQAVLASLGIKADSAVDLGGLTFSLRRLSTALDAASHGDSVEIRTMDGSRNFAVTWEVPSANSQEVYLQELPQGIRAHIAEPLLKLVSNDASEIRTLLQQHNLWLDYGEPERSVRVDQIALQPEAWRRIDMVLEARKESSAWYYHELLDTARRPNINIPELLPPSIASLLRYHRLDPDLAATEFLTALDNSAQRLLADEGIEEALRRLGGLPVPLPTSLLKALAELETSVREDIMQRALVCQGWPITTFHLVRARLSMLGKTTVLNEVLTPLVEPLWEDTQLLWAKASVAILRWTGWQFDISHEPLTTPAPLRLALVWSHAYHLMRAFVEVGAKPEGLYKAFSMPQGKVALGPDILHPDFSYLNDVIHPDRVTPETMLFQGTLFALDHRLPEGISISKEDWWLSITTNEAEGTRSARLPFLRAHRSTSNLIHSFLSWELWQNLSSLLTEPNLWAPPTEEFFERKISEALEQLGTEPFNPESWMLLSGVIGTGLPPSETAATLASRLTNFDFAGLREQEPRLAGLILLWAARTVPNLENPAASERIRAQILAAAEVVRHDLFPLQESNADMTALEENQGSGLFEASRWASMTKGAPLKSAEQFASLMRKLVDTRPEISSAICLAVERLSRIVPLDQAVHLRPLILHLRANS